MKIIKREEALEKAKEIGEKEFIESVKYLNDQLVASIGHGNVYYTYFKDLRNYPRLREAIEEAGYTLEYESHSSGGFTRIIW